MIDLSRFRGVARATMAALLMTASASVVSCNVIGASCNGTSCNPILTVYFDGAGSADSGATDGSTLDGGAPANSIEIDIEAETNQAFFTLRTCWLILGGAREVVCDDGEGRIQALGVNALVLQSGMVAHRVTMSMNGVQISQETLSVNYVTRTCGCGDFTTTSGTAHIQLPPP